MSNNFTKACLVGTAPSWSKTPWNDPSAYIISLNDAYSLGVPRANAWSEMHPFHEMWFRPPDKTEFKHGEIPPLPDGRMPYIRPHGHLEWLQEKAKTIEVFLQHDPPPGWPVNAKKFPFEGEVKKLLKARPDQECYSASSPTPILAYLAVRGFKEIHIYGIHLSTQKEYIEQRPNFEWLIGKLEAMGINIVLPPECPLLKHTHVYAYEPAPVRPDLHALERKHKAQVKLQRLANDLIAWPRWKSKAAPLREMAFLQAEIRDAQQEGRRAQLLASGA